MSGIATFATAPTVQTIAWALVNFLWQGALVGLAAAVALRHLRSRSASARYALAVGALLAMLALPVATAVRIGGSAGTELSATGTPTAETVVESIASAGPLPGLAVVRDVPSGLDLSILRAALSPGLPWIFGLWLAGVALLALYHLGGWRQTRRMASSGRPLPAELEARVLDLGRRLGIARAVRLLESSAVSVPAVIGWLKPAILVPASSLVGLSPWQLEAVLAHELAHVRRHDALVNLLQAAVETLLFFHPAVWWVSGQVRAERENCCDDLAVAVCGDRLSYARALADLEGLRAPLPPLARAADGGSLLDRVRRLVGAPARPPGRSWLAGLLALSILPFGLTLQWGGGTRSAANGAGVVTSSAPQRLTAAEGARRSEETNQTTPGAGGSGQGTTATTADPRRGSWTATRQGDQVDLETMMSWKSVGESHRWHVGETYEAKDLVGLTAGPDVRFELRREAGTFLFEGRFAGAKGSGTFTFQPNPAYPREMAALGYTVEPARQMEMAMQDVSVSFAREIRSLGFQDTTLDQLVQMRIQGVTAEYARALGSLGIADLSADQLIQLKIQGVSPAWIRGLNTAGYRDLSSDQLMQLKIQGVSAEWVQGLAAAGSRHPSADELVQLKIQGVSSEWVRGLADAGYRNLSADQMVQLKIQGVSGAWVRELADAGFPGGSADELVQLKIQGVTGPFVRQAVSRYGKLSADDLVQLKIGGRLDR